MIPAAPDDTSLSALVEWLVQWVLASPVEAAIGIGVGLGVGIVTLVVCLRLGRWTTKTLGRLGIWIGTSAVALLTDLGHRWREPSVPVSLSSADGSASSETSTQHMAATGREYLRVRPTSAEYDVEALVTALDGLNSTHRRTEISGNWRRKKEEVLEFLVATPGPDAGVEFYVGGTMPLDRLAAALPYRQCGFDVERVSKHPAQLLDPRTSAEPGIDGSCLAESTPDHDAPVATPATDGGAVASTAPDSPAPGEHDDEDDADADGPAVDPTDALLAHLRDSDLEPVVYRLNTRGPRGNDWMMRLPGLTDLLETSPSGPDSSAAPSAAHPLTPVIETLDGLAVPAVYQVTARSFRSWDSQADVREYQLEHRRDTLGQKAAAFADTLLDGVDPAHVSHHRRDEPGRRGRRRSARGAERHSVMSRSGRKRRDSLDRTNPDATYVVNVRLAAIPTADHSRAEVASTVRTLRTDLDALEGEFYRLDTVASRRHERVTGLLGVRGPRHRQRLRRLCRRTLTTPVFGHTRFNRRRRWPDLVCTPDELGAWTSVPSTSWLPPRLTEAVEHDPGHARPLQPVSPSIRDRYVGHDTDGRTLGYALTDDGGPDLEQPFRLPVADLRTHEVRQGLPGCGKTTDMAGDVLADHRATTGPTLVFTGPGGDLAELVMRGVAVEEGLDHLRENVHWFRVPAVQPGITFFDIRTVQGADDVTDWVHAAGDIADKYIRVARSLIGAEAFDRAPLSKDTLRAYVAAGFDPGCYPAAPADDSLLMPHRETEPSSVYRLWQLEAQVAAVSELTQAASQREYRTVAARLPDVSDPRLARNLGRPFQFDQRTAANVLGGVQTRLSAISNNARLAELFDNTVERFGFHTILEGDEADDIFIFDLGALTDVSQRAYALTLLSVLELQLKSHADVLDGMSGGDYLATLHIDEAAQLVDTPEFGEFLDVIRNYTLGVNVTVQNPEQVRERGGERTYRSLLEHTQTTVLGPGISDRQAGELCPADWEDGAFKDHVRDFPESRRLVQLPPQADQTRPQVFELHRGPLPEWHTDASGGSFADPSFRERFEVVKADVKQQTDETYGVPAGEAERAIREQRELGVPAVTDTLGLARDNLAAFLGLVTRHAQQAAAVDDATASGRRPPDADMAPDESGGDGDRSAPSAWVPVSEVYSRFMTQIDVALADVDADADEAAVATDSLPHHEDVAACIDDSSYFETALADEPTMGSTPAGGDARGESDASVMVRLTPEGQQVAADLEGPGEGVTTGSDEHAEMLQTVQTALQRAGPIELRIVEQDGTDQVDAIGGLRRTVDGHPETVTITVEAERSESTLSHPTKPLQNLRKAQEADAVALFAVPARNPEDGEELTTYARRLAGILADPYNRRRSEPRYYVHDRRLTFHGGASDGGETVVRPRDDEDPGRSIWMAREGGAELRAPDGNVLATIDDPVTMFEEVPLEEFPAYYTYDPRTDQYTVHEHGAHYRYEDSDDLEADWAPVKEPFVPERELPVADYDAHTYAILIVHTDELGKSTDGDVADRSVSVYVGGDTSDDVRDDDVVDDGRLGSLEYLIEALESGALHPPTAPGDQRPRVVDHETVFSTPEPPTADTQPETVDQPTSDAADPSTVSGESRNDGIAAFAERELTHSPGTIVPLGQVYDRYEAFTNAAGFDQESRRRFSTALKMHYAATLDPGDWEGDEPVESGPRWYSPREQTVRCLEGVELEAPSPDDEAPSDDG